MPLLTTTDGPGLAFSDYLTVVGGGLPACLLCAALGVGFGALIGNQVAGVVGALVFFFVIEPLAAWPGTTCRSSRSRSPPAQIGGAQADPAFPFPGSLAVLVAWTAILLLARA